MCTSDKIRNNIHRNHPSPLITWESCTTGDVSLEDVREATQTQLLYPVDMHSFYTDPPGPLTLLDMPVVDIISKGFVKCFVDVIVDVQGSPPVNEIKASLQAKAIKELPQPYSLAWEIACSLKFDSAIIKQNRGNHMVVQIVRFSEKAKVERIRGCATPRSTW